jgi:hypothetical protein
VQGMVDLLCARSNRKGHQLHGMFWHKSSTDSCAAAELSTADNANCCPASLQEITTGHSRHWAILGRTETPSPSSCIGKQKEMAALRSAVRVVSCQTSGAEWPRCLQWSLDPSTAPNSCTIEHSLAKRDQLRFPYPLYVNSAGPRNPGLQATHSGCACPGGAG